MPRPKRERLVVYVGVGIKAALAGMAAERGQSVSEFIRVMLYDFVNDRHRDNSDPPPQNQGHS